MILFSILVTGLGVIPREPYLLTAQNPYDHVQIYPENYFQSSFLLPLVANLLGFTSPTLFRTFSLALVLIALAGFAILMRAKHGPRVGILASGLLLAHPMTVVLLSWLGTPDGITVLLTSATLSLGHVGPLFVMGLLGIINHPAFVVSGLSILVLRRASHEQGLRPSGLGALVAGLVGGAVLVQAFLIINQIDVFSRLDFILQRGPWSLIKLNLVQLPAAVYSFHGTLWIALGFSLLNIWRRNRAYTAIWLGLQLGYIIVTALSADTTRVFTLMGWGPAIHCVLYAHRMVTEEEDGVAAFQLRSVALVSVALGLLAPRIYVWTGELHGSPFYPFYVEIVHFLRQLLTLG